MATKSLGLLVVRSPLNCSNAAEPLRKPTMSADTAGKPITCNAMVARGPKQPLALETITGKCIIRPESS